MPFVFGIKTTGFPFFDILAPQKDHRTKGGNPYVNQIIFYWEAGAKRRQSFGGLIEN